jgi:hypothetical protein
MIINAAYEPTEIISVTSSEENYYEYNPAK